MRPRRAQPAVALALQTLPPLCGRPILLEFRGALWVRRGRLTARPPGVEVHAATFLRRRSMYLAGDLLGDLRELRRILIHELFHFVWLRLANAERRDWEALLAEEIRRGACGELGHSAERRKEALAPAAVRARGRRWREYVAESFCDSAAWWFVRPARHEEFTLGKTWCARRSRWIARLIKRAWLPV